MFRSLFRWNYRAVSKVNLRAAKKESGCSTALPKSSNILQQLNKNIRLWKSMIFHKVLFIYNYNILTYKIQDGLLPTPC